MINVALTKNKKKSQMKRNNKVHLETLLKRNKQAFTFFVSQLVFHNLFRLAFASSEFTKKKIILRKTNFCRINRRDFLIFVCVLLASWSYIKRQRQSSGKSARNLTVEPCGESLKHIANIFSWLWLFNCFWLVWFLQIVKGQKGVCVCVRGNMRWAKRRSLRNITKTLFQLVFNNFWLVKSENANLVTASVP